MIPQIEGDLLEFPVPVIVHGCNTLNIMRAGLARQIAERYPEALEADTIATKLEQNKLGHISHAQCTDNPEHLIINLYQQSEFGKLNILAFEKALIRAVEFVESVEKARNMEPVSMRIGIPYKIGCGLAKGDWTEVLSVLYKISKEYPNRLTTIKRTTDS